MKDTLESDRASASGSQRGSAMPTLIDGASGLLVALVVAAVLSPIAVMGIDPWHDGWLFPVARDVAEGATLYTEAGTGYGGVTTLIQGSWMRHFGVSLPAFKYSAVAAYALAAALFHVAFRGLVPNLWLVVVLGLWLGLTPSFHVLRTFLAWSSVYVLVFQAIVLVCLRRRSEGGRGAWLAVAGAAATLAVFTRQPVGVFLLGSLLAFVVFTRASRLHHRGALTLGAALRGREMPSVLVGVASALCVWLGWVAWLGGLTDLWRLEFLLPANWIAGSIPLSTRSLSGMFYPWAADQGERIYILLPVLLVAFGLRGLAREWRRPSTGAEAFALAALFVCAASWLQYFPVSDRRHTYWAMTPFFWTLALSIYLAKREQARVWWVGSLLGIALLAIPEIVHNVGSLPAKAQRNSETISSVSILEGVRVPLPTKGGFVYGAEVMRAEAERDPGRPFVQVGYGSHGLWYSLSPRPGLFGHPMFSSGVAASGDRVYPDRSKFLRKLLQSERPFVVSGKPLRLPGYEFVSLRWSRHKPFDGVSAGFLGVPGPLPDDGE